MERRNEDGTKGQSEGARWDEVMERRNEDGMILLASWELAALAPSGLPRWHFLTARLFAEARCRQTLSDELGTVNVEEHESMHW